MEAASALRQRAKQMLGQTMPLRNVPFFWTYHFDKAIKYLGDADKWDDVFHHGDVRRLNFLAILSRRDESHRSSEL